MTTYRFDADTFNEYIIPAGGGEFWTFRSGGTVFVLISSLTPIVEDGGASMRLTPKEARRLAARLIELAERAETYKP